MFSVIFDMDGTLLDTQRIAIPAWDWAGELQGFKGMGKYVPNACGVNVNGRIKYLRESFPGLDVEKFEEDFGGYIRENIVVCYKPGALELLQFLKKKGIRIALASGSNHETIDHNLNEVGATDIFDVAVGGVDVENGKPAPDIFLLAAKKLGADPENCFVIEDSANGIKAGHTAGMKCIGIPDIVAFDDDTKKLMYAELSSMHEAIKLFEDHINQTQQG